MSDLSDFNTPAVKELNSDSEFASNLRDRCIDHLEEMVKVYNSEETPPCMVLSGMMSCYTTFLTQLYGKECTIPFLEKLLSQTINQAPDLSKLQ